MVASWARAQGFSPTRLTEAEQPLSAGDSLHNRHIPRDLIHPPTQFQNWNFSAQTYGASQASPGAHIAQHPRHPASALISADADRVTLRYVRGSALARQRRQGAKQGMKTGSSSTMTGPHGRNTTKFKPFRSAKTSLSAPKRIQ